MLHRSSPCPTWPSGRLTGTKIACNLPFGLKWLLHVGLKIVEKVDRDEDEGDIYVGDVAQRLQEVPWWAPENFPRPVPNDVYVPPPAPSDFLRFVPMFAGGTLAGQQDTRERLEPVGITIQEVIPTSGYPSTPPIIGGNGDMSALDSLLNAATNIYSVYQQSQQQPQQFLPAPSWMPSTSVGLPLVDVVSQTPPKKGMLYNPVTGKWVHCRRRRRRRIATLTDVKDLAALKGVLGNGKAFEVWIATH